MTVEFFVSQERLCLWNNKDRLDRSRESYFLVQLMIRCNIVWYFYFIIPFILLLWDGENNYDGVRRRNKS